MSCLFNSVILAVNPSRCAGMNEPNQHEELTSLLFQCCSKDMFLGFHFHIFIFAFYSLFYHTNLIFLFCSLSSFILFHFFIYFISILSHCFTSYFVHHFPFHFAY